MDNPTEFMEPSKLMDDVEELWRTKMLHEEVSKYRRLTGDNTSDQIPILRLGGYLDGFDKGIEIGIKALQEVWQAVQDVDISNPTVPEYVEHHQQMQEILVLIDKRIKEMKDEA